MVIIEIITLHEDSFLLPQVKHPNSFCFNPIYPKVFRVVLTLQHVKSVKVARV